MRQSPETRVVRAGLPEPQQNAPFRPGPVLASTFALAGEVTGEWVYARNGNPTWSDYEAAHGELDGGTSLVFASGMAAISAVLLSRLRPGSVLAAPADCYNVTLALARRLPGVEMRTAPTLELPGIVAGADLVWVETPSNPLLDLVDLPALRAATDGLLVVDNTLPTALAQRPLDLGADLVVSADTKLVNGHSDLLLGHVSGTDEVLMADLLEWRRLTGGVPSAQDVWLAHRSLATFGLRHERVCANALALAELLAARSLPTRYPGLPSHPQHALAARQMRAYGGVLGVELESAEQAQRFLGECALVDEATSFGGSHTTGERRARWGADPVSEGYVRLSAGLEATADLVADVSAALDATMGS